jgi:hypothetical protein
MFLWLILLSKTAIFTDMKMTVFIRAGKRQGVLCYGWNITCEKN